MSTSVIFQLAQDGDANNLLYHIQDHIDDINKQDAVSLFLSSIESGIFSLNVPELLEYFQLGCSPLIYAAWGGYMTLVCMLINVGCDLNIQNRVNYYRTKSLHCVYSIANYISCSGEQQLCI